MTYVQDVSSLTKTVTIATLKQMKQQQAKFATIALYDAPMAAMAEKCGVEVVLVGDSLGMTVLGFESTVPVTMEHMIHHVGAVRRGNQKSLIVADLPFMSYSRREQALDNAARIMQAGAHVVKMEGGEWLTPAVAALAERGIPVCGHLGLIPQSVNKLGGFHVQGRNPDKAEQLLQDARSLESAGADLLVLECIPSSLAKKVTDELSIPTIGIGAGPDTDAQVLVINDILGLTEKPPRFSKDFLADAGDIPGALRQYVADVKSGVFPDAQHAFK